MQERDFAALQVKLSHDDISQNRQVLLSTIAKVGLNQFDQLEEYFTEDAELHIHGFAELDGTWIGRKQVIEAIQNNFAKITHQKPALKSMIEQGDIMAVRLDETGVLVNDQCGYHADALLWYTFLDGRIHRIEEFVKLSRHSS